LLARDFDGGETAGARTHVLQQLTLQHEVAHGTSLFWRCPALCGVGILEWRLQELLVLFGLLIAQQRLAVVQLPAKHKPKYFLFTDPLCKAGIFALTSSPKFCTLQEH